MSVTQAFVSGVLLWVVASVVLSALVGRWLRRGCPDLSGAALRARLADVADEQQRRADRALAALTAALHASDGGR